MGPSVLYSHKSHPPTPMATAPIKPAPDDQSKASPVADLSGQIRPNPTIQIQNVAQKGTTHRRTRHRMPLISSSSSLAAPTRRIEAWAKTEAPCRVEGKRRQERRLGSPLPLEVECFPKFCSVPSVVHAHFGFRGFGFRVLALAVRTNVLCKKLLSQPDFAIMRP
jgi:hypothetical protein